MFTFIHCDFCHIQNQTWFLYLLTLCALFFLHNPFQLQNSSRALIHYWIVSQIPVFHRKRLWCGSFPNFLQFHFLWDSPYILSLHKATVLVAIWREILFHTLSFQILGFNYELPKSFLVSINSRGTSPEEEFLPSPSGSLLEKLWNIL